ncbi:MAG: choice-of-anchor tandem repeat GloVer-containing protein [Verrucomicrobiia bacterium]
MNKPTFLNLLFVSLLVLAGNADAGTTDTILHSFSGGATDGANPYGSVIADGGKLYGMTYNGGVSSKGVMYSMNANGSGYEILHTFTGVTGDGASSWSTLIKSGDVIYGTTMSGGVSNRGVVFSINANGTGFQALHEFTGGSGGQSPLDGLTLSGGKLYGTTGSGGSANQGTVFSLNANGTGFSILHTLTGNEGQGPRSRLVVSGSEIFGATTMGGVDSGGTVFMLHTDGTGFQKLKDLPYDVGGGTPQGPFGGLTLINSTLYGVRHASSPGGGQIFSIGTNGLSYTTLYTLQNGVSGTTGNAGELQLINGQLWGTTYYDASGKGTVFSLNLNGTSFKTEYTFLGGTGDGSNPWNMSLAYDGAALYGTTINGGASDLGTVFSIALIPEPSTWAMIGAGVLGLLATRRRRA